MESILILVKHLLNLNHTEANLDYFVQNAYSWLEGKKMRNGKSK